METQQWISDAEESARFAARNQAARLNLPPDGDRDSDAAGHAREQAEHALRLDPDFYSTAEHCKRWFHQVARNWVRDQARAARIRERHERSRPRPESRADHTELYEKLRNAIAVLEPDVRAVFERRLQEMTWQEIATDLGLPLGTVYGQYRSALPQLRHELAERGATAEDLLDPIELFGAGTGSD